MGYLDSLNITGSALTAERFRTDIILQNLANQNTTRTEEGGPYRRRQVVLRERPLDFKSELSQAYTKVQNGGVYVEEVVESQNDLVPMWFDAEANFERFSHKDSIDYYLEKIKSVGFTHAIVDIRPITGEDGKLHEEHAGSI